MTTTSLLSEPTQIKYYRSILVSLMSFLGKASSNDINQPFSTEILASITPEDIYRFFCKKAFQKESPTAEDKPTYARSSSLKYWKKAISYFIPNKKHMWDEITLRGNPTKSPLITGLIRAVSKKEAKQEGKVTQTDRPFERTEVDQILSILESFPDYKCKYKITALIRLQIHMMGRVDDVSSLKITGIKPNLEFDFTLFCQMCWSKNVLEERDAPNQIILGAMNRQYCVLLSLAVYFESCVKPSTPLSLLFAENLQTSKNVKKTVMDTLRNDVYSSNSFRRVLEGPIGTHSLRKFSSTFATRNGCAREEVDRRGRWRRRKQANDTYFDLNLPFPDAKVAAKLCVGGGPCKYKLVANEAAGITDDLLRRVVVPTTASIFHPQVALTLALPLLWAVYDVETSPLLPHFLTARIRQALPNVTQNPVAKVPIAVFGQDAILRIEEVTNATASALLVTRAGGPEISQSHVDGFRFQSEYFGGLDSKLTKLDQKSTDLKVTFSEKSAKVESQLVSLNNLIRRGNMFASFRTPFSTQRGLNADCTNANVESQTNRASENNEGSDLRKRKRAGAPTDYETSLSPCPKDLYVLWLEYEQGIGGRKPAKEFTAAERGKVKFSYCRRKLVWDRIEKLLARGHIDANDAITTLYRKYGEKCTVSQIIQKLIDEKKAGVL